MRGKRLGVEKLGKSTNQNSLFALPEDTSSCGTIVFLGEGLAESDLKVGMKVYFGDKRQQVRIEGRDVQVMDEENVLAIAD
jgi:co-chaperonin GroES (HSP10)